VLQELISKLEFGLALNEEEIDAAIKELVSEAETPEAKALFLEALSKKGETPEEIVGFVKAARRLSILVELPNQLRERGVLDVVGTGGDNAGTINVSTAVAIICAAAGILVCKHGNRAATSKCGSADLLEALGIKIELDPEEAVEWLERYNFAFLFAPRYHPAFKHVAQARKICAQRGVRTIFNFLGPLLNPANPTHMLLGVMNEKFCLPIAQVLAQTGVKRGMVVTGLLPDGESLIRIDELSTVGPNTIAEFDQSVPPSLFILDTSSWGFEKADASRFRGSDPRANAQIITEIFKGRSKGPRVEIICLNAGAAFFVVGKAKSIQEGVKLAAEVIESGSAAEKLCQLQNASRV